MHGGGWIDSKGAKGYKIFNCKFLTGDSWRAERSEYLNSQKKSILEESGAEKWIDHMGVGEEIYYFY